MTTVTVARDGEQQLLHVAPLVDGEAGERLVEQQHLRVLRQRHGNLHAAALAVGGLRQRPLGYMVEADTGQRGARPVVTGRDAPPRR